MGPDASVSPELIQAQSFTAAFRGYDQGEVRSFLHRVAAEMRALRERAENLESAWHSAEERAARPPVLDEDTLMAAVGEETASILRSARAAAGDMRTKAAEDVDRLLSEARAESDRLRAEARSEADQLLTHARSEAERMLAEAREGAERTSSEAQQSAARLVADASARAEEVVEKARAEAEAVRVAAEKDRLLTIEGATSTRDRILEDLSRRRRVATVQIEQLRAGRERLIESYAVVRRTLEEVTSELSRADTAARAAAAEAGQRLEEAGEEAAADPLAAFARPEQGEAEPAEPAPDESGRVVDAGAPAAAADHNAGEADAPSEPAATTDAVAAATTEAVAAAITETAPEAVTEQVPVAATTAAAPASAVDELFARIRAPRAGEPLAATDEKLEPDAPVVSGEGQDHAGLRPAGDERDSGEAPADGADAEADERPLSDADERRLSDADERRLSDADERRLSDADESLFQRRESAVVDLEVTLTRRLKRALQDEQNDVLDRLRNLTGEPSAANLLPDHDRQVARYAEAARPSLASAAGAGAAFAVAALRERSPEGLAAEDQGPRPDALPVDATVDDLAAEAGTGIVEPLRRRLEEAVVHTAGDDQSVLVEALGAAYREWKTARIERLAGDVLAAAFSRGTWQAAPEGTLMRWIVEDTDGPCPDCDDDALAGDLPKGEVFPTGQLHPPAHSGCRCLLVPTPAGQ